MSLAKGACTYRLSVCLVPCVVCMQACKFCMRACVHFSVACICAYIRVFMSACVRVSVARLHACVCLLCVCVSVARLHACMCSCECCVHACVRAGWGYTSFSWLFHLWSLDFATVGYEIKGLQFIWRKYALEAIIKLLFISLYHDKCLLFMLELY